MADTNEETTAAAPPTETEVVELKGDDKKHFLANIVSSVSGAASRLYDKSSTFVKEKSPGFVKVTIEKVENKVGSLAQHPTVESVITRVSQYGTWAVDATDEKLDGYYNRLQQRRASFLESELGQKVNKSLDAVKERVYDPSAEFYRRSMEKFRELQEAAKKRGEEGKVSAEQFVAGLRERLGQAWNEKLVEPAKAFHSAATENATAVRERLGQEWDTHVKPHFSIVTQPANAFYDVAARSYTTLWHTSQSGTVTLTEFVAGIRVQLGKVWNQNLLQPAQHLFQQFNSSAAEDAAAANDSAGDEPVADDTVTQDEQEEKSS